MAGDLPEVWLRGPIDDVPAMLQPVAHALLQASEEIERVAVTLDVPSVNARPGGVASVAFHLRHIAGVCDRLFTYARGERLDAVQLAYLRAESAESSEPGAVLAAATIRAIYTAVERLRSIDPGTLLEPRGVGRNAIPSNVLGLLVHAAEHTTRHTGQLLVTARIVTAPRA